MLLRRLIGEKVTLEVKHGRDLWPVKADISQLEQVIVNLAVNARDAMPDGGRLQVRTANVTAKECERYNTKGMLAAYDVLVEVRDTGTGIPDLILGKIFDPFFSTKEVGKGTGLGLSTVYGIIKRPAASCMRFVLHHGTTFRIFLPRIFRARKSSPSRRPSRSAGDHPDACRGRSGQARRRRRGSGEGRQRWTPRPGHDPSGRG